MCSLSRSCSVMKTCESGLSRDGDGGAGIAGLAEKGRTRQPDFL